MRTQMQHAVITGGSGTLGRAIAAVLQSPEWTVAMPDRHELDVRDCAAIGRYFQGRPVDLLVCAAGIIRDGPLLAMSETDWSEVWDVNFKGAAACAKAVLPAMIAQQRGHLVFLSSFSALHPPAGQAAYATAKAALLGHVYDLASRLGPANIRVNAVLPGFVVSRMTAGVGARRRAEILAAHVLGRFNTCERTAGFIAYLHHHLPDTSGQIFQLDSRLDLARF